MYLLDTNHLTHPARLLPEPDLVARTAEELTRHRAATASVCWYEAWAGVRKGDSRRAEVWLRTLASSGLAILSYDREAAELQARWSLGSRDSALGTRAQRDAAIAATALAHGVVLVTDNLKDFARYRAFGLQLENWLR